jgi:hypothetical protein
MPEQPLFLWLCEWLQLLSMFTAIDRLVQAALMAQHDSRSPALIVTASAAFSLAGDIVLVTILRQGLAGAAIATVAAQYLSFAALLWVCCQPGSLRPVWPAAARKLAGRTAAIGRSGHKGISAFCVKLSEVPAAGFAAFHREMGWTNSSRLDSVLADPETWHDSWESPGQSTQAASDAVSLVAAHKLTPAAGFSPPPSTTVLASSDAEGDSVSTSASDSDVDNAVDANGTTLFDSNACQQPSAQLQTGPASHDTAAPQQTGVDAEHTTHQSHVEHDGGRLAQGHDKASHHDLGQQAHEGGSATHRGAMLAAVYAAKLLCYFTIQGTAMRLAVFELAAHNAMFSLWNVCAYFPVPLQTTALTFVPRCSSDAVRLTPFFFLVDRVHAQGAKPPLHGRLGCFSFVKTKPRQSPQF